MGRYRTYKNGITGHKYKDLYIIKGESKGDFRIIDENKNEIAKDLYDYDECEWYIDKMKASEYEIETIKNLYKMEIFELTTLMFDFIEKKDRGNYEEEDKIMYELVQKVRKRKVEDKVY